MNRQHLQDTYLNYLRREQLPVTVYLINGFQLKGLVRAFDSFTVVLDQDGRQMLVYKHALSTISPSRPVPLQVLASAGVQAGNESAGPAAPQDRPDSMASIPPHHRPG